jgi:hypothetical protein
VLVPYTSNSGWRNLRDNHPAQWAEAVAFDRAIRAGSARANANGVPLRGQAFLHPSLRPLDQAPIDTPLRRRHSRPAGQEEAEDWEDGDPDGCSPWACSRTAALRLAGNGVVPHHAEAAFRELAHRAAHTQPT